MSFYGNITTVEAGQDSTSVVQSTFLDIIRLTRIIAVKDSDCDCYPNRSVLIAAKYNLSIQQSVCTFDVPATEHD